MNSPSSLQAVILGLCLGSIYGLFFYQRYRSQYFWILTVVTGIASGVLMNIVLRPVHVWETQFVLAAALQILLPSIVIIFVNRLLVKQTKKRRRTGKSDLDSLIPTHSFTSFL